MQWATCSVPVVTRSAASKTGATVTQRHELTEVMHWDKRNFKQVKQISNQMYLWFLLSILCLSALWPTVCVCIDKGNHNHIWFACLLGCLWFLGTGFLCDGCHGTAVSIKTEQRTQQSRKVHHFQKSYSVCWWSLMQQDSFECLPSGLAMHPFFDEDYSIHQWLVHLTFHHRHQSAKASVTADPPHTLEHHRVFLPDATWGKLGSRLGLNVALTHVVYSWFQ